MIAVSGGDGFLAKRSDNTPVGVRSRRSGVSARLVPAARRLAIALACALAALAVAGQAAAKKSFGVADTHPVGMPDHGAKFFDLMNDIGMNEDRITILWDAAHPARIDRKAELERMVEQAKAHRIEIVFSVFPQRATALAANPGAATQFVTFLQIVANAFPDVTTFVVGNEFNQPKFYQPQFDANCKSASGGSYMRLLARGYDALKAVNPDITVISSVSPRGNDDCDARSNVSTSPVRFVRDMGIAYRALHRDRAAFDEFGIHLYPNQPTDPIEKGYQWPKVGASNLNRLKQALWDAYHDTAQPVPDWQPATFSYGQGLSALQPVKIWAGEVGWQVKVASGHAKPYYGRENVQVTTEERQAKIYADLVRMMNCDTAVDAMLLYGLVDEPDLDRFQAGLLRADWTPRDSYSTVKQAIARAKSGCEGQPVQWRHSDTVLGAGVDFGKLRVQSLRQRWWGFSATAKEDAGYSAGIFQVRGRALTDTGRDAIVRALAGEGGAKAVLSERNTIKAYWSPIVRFPSKTLRRGNYVYGIRISAAMNPDRTQAFVSRVFQVGK